MGNYKARQLTALIICLVAVIGTYVLHRYNEAQSQQYLNEYLNGSSASPDSWGHASWTYYTKQENDQTRYIVKIVTPAGTITQKLPLGYRPKKRGLPFHSDPKKRVSWVFGWRKEYINYTKQELIDMLVEVAFYTDKENTSEQKEPEILDRKQQFNSPGIIYPLGKPLPEHTIIL